LEDRRPGWLPRPGRWGPPRVDGYDRPGAFRPHSASHHHMCHSRQPICL